MTDIVDGSFDTPKGRKVFVSRRPDESTESFAIRVMALLQATSDGQVLDLVLASEPSEWEKLPSERWLDAINRTDPTLRLRLTTLESDDGGSVGHLVVDCDDNQILDDWGDLQAEWLYLPRAEDGRISSWQAVIWSLAHEIKGVGDLYDSVFECSGLHVE
jgi:hypothetical protein